MNLLAKVFTVERQSSVLKGHVCFAQISVEDADEPPVFVSPSYTFEVEENAPEGTVVGRVHAQDTDMAHNLVR